MKKQLLFFGLSIISGNILSQDNYFVNPQQTLTYLNPSFAGSNGGIRTQAIHRIQNNDQFNYNANFVSFDMYLKRTKGGLTVNNKLSNYNNGFLLNEAINVGYAQHFTFKNKDMKIIPALQVSYLRRELDYTKVNFGQPYADDVSFNEPPQNKIKRHNIGLTASLLFNYKSFYFGGSVFNFNRPDVGLLSSSKLSPKIQLSASYTHGFGENVIINVTTFFVQQGNPESLQLGVNGLFLKHIMAGSGITDRGYYFNSGYKARKFSVGLSAEITNGGLFHNNSSGSYSSYEFFASFNLPGGSAQKGNTVAFEKF